MTTSRNSEGNGRIGDRPGQMAGAPGAAGNAA